MQHSNQLEKPSRQSYNRAKYDKENGTTSNLDQTKSEDSSG
jgi:hypothetical protein